MSTTRHVLLLALLALCTSCEAPIVARNTNPVLRSTIVEVWRVPKVSRYLPSSLDVQSVRTAPLVEGDRIYIAYDSTLECLNKNSGERLWTVSLREGPSATAHSLGFDADEILSDEGNLYVLSAHAIGCYTKAAGSLVWSFGMAESLGLSKSEMIGLYSNANCLSSDAIFLTTWGSGELIKLDKHTGRVLWRSKGAVLDDPVYENVKFISLPTAPALVGNRVYVGGRYGRGQIPGIYHDGTVACFDAQTGSRLWIKLIPRADSTAGYHRWDLLTENDIRIPPLPYDNGVIVAAGFCLLRIDSSGNILWRRTPNVEGNVGLYSVTLTMRNRKLYLINDAYAYCMEPSDGSTIWSNWFSPQVGDAHTFHNPIQFTSNRMFVLTDDWYVIGADLLAGTVSFAAALYRHLAGYDKGDDFILEGAFTVFDDKLVAVDLNYIYCWQIQ